MHKIKKDDGRNNTTWGLTKYSPAKSETGNFTRGTNTLWIFKLYLIYFRLKLY
jgi:hypothetical protein